MRKTNSFVADRTCVQEGTWQEGPDTALGVCWQHHQVCINDAFSLLAAKRNWPGANCGNTARLSVCNAVTCISMQVVAICQQQQAVFLRELRDYQA